MAKSKRNAKSRTVRSMTGFGRAATAGGGGSAGRLVVEVRSVNQRFLKIAVKLPGPLSPIESRIRDAVKARMTRGTVDVFVLPDDADARRPTIDETAVREYVSSWRRLAKRLKLTGELTLDSVAHAFLVAGRSNPLAADGARAAPERIWKPLSAALGRAIDQLDAMRLREGGALARDLQARIAKMRKRVAGIARRAPAAVKAHRARLRARVKDLLDGRDATAWNNGIERDVVLLAERSDVTEELQRLKSHFDQMESALRGGGEVGKRLDFLAQEMNREINTIGSKSSDPRISRHVVELKGELEKIREQCANLE